MAKPRTIVMLKDEEMLPGFSGFIGFQSSDGTVIYSHEFKEWLFHAQEGTCGYCGCDLGDTWIANRKAHLEHIENRRLGGSDLPPNLMYSCHSCNVKKGADHFSVMTDRLRLQKSPAYKVISRAQIIKLEKLGIDMKIPNEEPLHFMKTGWSHVRAAFDINRQREAAKD